jgi:hypothetical protein
MPYQQPFTAQYSAPATALPTSQGSFLAIPAASTVPAYETQQTVVTAPATQPVTTTQQVTYTSKRKVKKGKKKGCC